ncbi:hypothetical protein KIPB_009468 [Kipferlia bialata]|uniref:Uncharacterized protein n=1 Tax=Kipferlia bialata TaxID=797122 RepID=A0A9K3GM53_9EUKA|nr:hypothetical protein KIPB_009468 [Kipferlia bialata]|eukprot:g9468.t1
MSQPMEGNANPTHGDTSVASHAYELFQKAQAERSRYDALLVDYKYNLGLLQERDVELNEMQRTVAALTQEVTAASPVEQWAILSLTRRGTVKTQSIAGPPNPYGVFGMQLYRVGEVVVAYGGSVSSEGHRGKVLTKEPVWYMAVYLIDTDEWQTVPYMDGYCPGPRRFPRVFSVGDTLVVAAGWGKEKTSLQDTWLWSLETSLWRQVGDCPAGLHNTGATHGTSHHIYTGYTHYVYSGTNRQWCEERGDVQNGIFPNSILHTSLYGECQLLATRMSVGGKRRRRAVPILRDNVSLERVALEYLPLNHCQYRSLDHAKAVWFGNCTLLVVASEMVLLVEVDPSLLRPYVLF